MTPPDRALSSAEVEREEKRGQQLEARMDEGGKISPSNVRDLLEAQRRFIETIRELESRAANLAADNNEVSKQALAQRARAEAAESSPALSGDEDVARGVVAKFIRYEKDKRTLYKLTHAEMAGLIATALAQARLAEQEALASDFEAMGTPEIAAIIRASKVTL
jgi:hypothetical protein